MSTEKSSASRKAEIRAFVLGKRDALPLAEHREEGHAIVGRLLVSEAFRKARTVLGYCSFGSEIDTTPLLNAILAAGKTLVLPKLNPAAGGLDLYAVTSLDADLRPGTWGIREPDSACAPVALTAIDFILVPGIAFDRRGGRIGYGKGYYDKLLAAFHAVNRYPPAVAAAFDLQIVDSIPMESHDVPVDALVTGSGAWTVDNKNTPP